MIDALWISAGCAIVVIALADVFQSVIVPRPSGRRFRPSAYVSRYTWQTWRNLGMRIGDNERREEWLGTFAPLLLVTLLVMWVTLLISGYGFVFYGLRHAVTPVLDLPAAFYFAGTSLLTIGYGDIAATSGLARFFSIAAGASGLGVVAVVTSFLFSIFGAFQKREAFVVTVTNRGGAPPSGLELIETHARLGITDGLLDVARDAETWIAEVMETHLAYPVLTYFRSTHDDISWVGVLGALLDMATLVITTLNVPVKGEAILLHRIGRHLVNDFSNYFRLADDRAVGVDRVEFELAYSRLRDAGLPLHDLDTAWREFAAVRSTYAARLNTMAQYWRIPPAQWVGDRSFIGHHALAPLSAETSALIERS